ncbi:MAG TPA: hypothetical protein VFX01_07590 [Methylophilaceae bacterium]|nr:hypothetical protein [Methylophilaceae bacterium]
MGGLQICSVDGCDKKVSRAGYSFCYDHWLAHNKVEQNKMAGQHKAEAGKSSGLLNSTQLGEHLNISSKKLNKILAELGWVEASANGWVPTDQGRKLHAEQREHHPSKTPYVLWPEAILSSRILKNSVKELLEPNENLSIQDTESGKVLASSAEIGGLRNKLLKFKPTHRATDGHWVRSKAEALIDNWLYMSGVAHAYERLVPVDEELYCDFYIPSGKVYIEYWGLENDSKYKDRKETKQLIYKKYGLNLIELTEMHVQNLDDYLPSMLRKFGVIVD